MDINKLNKTVKFKGYDLLFYLNNNSKYTVRVVGDEEATKTLLASCKTKAVKPERLYFFIKGIKGKIADGILPNKKKVNTQDPIARLNEFCQRLWQKNFRTKVVKNRGRCYVVGTEKVAIILPNGIKISAIGDNKREAEAIAARITLNMIAEDEHYKKYL